MAYVFLAIGTVLVIYFFVMTESAERERKKRLQTAPGGAAGSWQACARPQAPAPPRMRSCPICGAEMGPSDRLYGEVYKAVPRDKVFIRGCPRCHALPGNPESRPDFLKEVGL